MTSRPWLHELSTCVEAGRVHCEAESSLTCYEHTSCYARVKHLERPHSRQLCSACWPSAASLASLLTGSSLARTRIRSEPQYRIWTIRGFRRTGIVKATS